LKITAGFVLLGLLVALLAYELSRESRSWGFVALVVAAIVVLAGALGAVLLRRRARRD